MGMHMMRGCMHVLGTAATPALTLVTITLPYRSIDIPGTCRIHQGSK